MERSLAVKARFAAAASRVDVACLRSVCGRLADFFWESGSPCKAPAAAKRPIMNARANDFLIIVLPRVISVKSAAHCNLTGPLGLSRPPCSRPAILERLGRVQTQELCFPTD